MKLMKDYLILQVKNLKVTIEGEKIIDNLSFEVEAGEIFVILGPNGAGKTVLLKVLLGLLPNEGEIKWKPNIKIGYVPQRLPFIKDFPLSVREFFKLKSSDSGSDKEILDKISSVGLSDKSILAKQIGVLSSGQFQRLLIAWALAGDPEVLFFDEPTAGIDAGGEETIYALLNRLKKERDLTVFLVTHDLNIIHQSADKVLCLNHQKICYGLPKKALTAQNLTKLFGEDVKDYQHHYD